MNSLVIDAFEFCRLKEQRSGVLAVADLPRLADESVDKAGNINWSLEGGSDGAGHPQLTLSVSGSVQLICQRCLTPFTFDISSRSILILAKDEATADAIDELLADESVEVIVGSRTFDVAHVIEDEALLAIPAAPKHPMCPNRLMPEVADTMEKVSPFAVLKSLKQ
ncbi:MAG: hypothetical protein JWQ00_1362 [Noviherbaspirillum sp.]|jgi:uncharacterized protein|nr:hypothetical protein [Noviherbaspirillum sp.]